IFESINEQIPENFRPIQFVNDKENHKLKTVVPNGISLRLGDDKNSEFWKKIGIPTDIIGAPIIRNSADISLVTYPPKPIVVTKPLEIRINSFETPDSLQ